MIRKLTKEDIKKVQIIGKSYKEDFDKLFDLTNYIESDIYHAKVYEENNEILGFIIYTILYGVCELELIVVDKKSRNKHIGSTLLKSLENSINKILLEVSVNNIIAYNMYLKNGFKVINTRKHYYGETDAYIMEKII